MTKIEFDIRVITIGERIRQLEGELIVLVGETPAHAKRNRVRLASVHLAKAAEQLEEESPLDLESTLALSIASVRQQKRCEEVGGEVSTTNGKGPGGNLSPFRNRQSLNTSGE